MSIARTPLSVPLVVGVVSALTLTVAFGLLAVGWPFFWIAFPIGFGGVLPAAIGVVRWYAGVSQTTSNTDQSQRGDRATTDADADETDDPIATLQRRYTSGEIGEAEFERRLERLLETESDGDDQSTLRSPSGDPSTSQSPSDDPVDRSRERERN